ncbi:hypothetical protein ABZ352_35535 [Streptomyces griseofuscus]|uniref:hypothetical protein n=1 Tax=Streptomyces griseofuscus TaxID=146922 RepID=UPI00340A4B09
MGERCGTDVPDVDEYNRDERIETYYQGWGARDLAERLVELEDELGADVDGICTGMHADVAEAQAAWADERLRADRFEAAWLSARRRASRAMGAWRYLRWREDAQAKEMREQDAYAQWLWGQMSERLAERDRYRLAWISARRRAADEANMAMEALDLIRADRDRWRAGHETAEAQLVRLRRENEQLRAELEQRKTTHAPRLECVGTDEDGEIWRLARSENS